MRTRLTRLLGIEYPIIAFSHCRDVVAAVSRAGGLGVFGASRCTPEQLDRELTQLDRELDGRPYGVDVLLPAPGSPTAPTVLEQPSAALAAFVEELRARFEVPRAAPGLADERSLPAPVITMERGRAAAQVALSHRVRVIASALGPAPGDIVEEAHAAGAFVTGLCGTAEQARRHAAAGADFVVAQGHEAGGHTGQITTMVLVPEVVAAIAPVPVVAAGGIATGAQVAAALALGAEAVWTGSVWLTTSESDVHPALRERLLAAGSGDTVRTRWVTGKPMRQLRVPIVDAWEQAGAPAPLSAPAQGHLTADLVHAIASHQVVPAMWSPVGQVVGQLTSVTRAADVLADLVEGFIDAATRIDGMLSGPESPRP